MIAACAGLVNPHPARALSISTIFLPYGGNSSNRRMHSISWRVAQASVRRTSRNTMVFAQRTAAVSGTTPIPTAFSTILHTPSKLRSRTLVTNVWQLAAGPRFGFLIRRLWPMFVAICAGTWAGAGLITGNTEIATRGLGVALVLYSIAGLAAVKIQVPPRAESWLSPLVGLATGFTGAATGVFVLPAVPYFHALGLEKDELVQALGLSFTVSTLALAVDLAHGGTFVPLVAGISLAALAPALAGIAIGGRVRNKVSPETFRRWLFLGLLLLGAYLAML